VGSTGTGGVPAKRPIFFIPVGHPAYQVPNKFIILGSYPVKIKAEIEIKTEYEFIINFHPEVNDLFIDLAAYSIFGVDF
jgi:hypothetical protein